MKMEVKRKSEATMKKIRALQKCTSLLTPANMASL